jgi:hypothetical protein
MTSIFDFDTWAEWFQTLDSAWLFLLIMALVVAVIRFWSKSLWPDQSDPPIEDKHRPEP